MTVYFQGSELESLWPNPNLGTYAESNATIDATWSRAAASVQSNGYAGYIEADSGSNLTTFWFHDRAGRRNANALNASAASSLSIYTAAGVEAVRVTHPGNEQLQLQYKDAGAVWQNVGAVFDFHNSQTMDLRIQLGNGISTPDILELYRDEILVAGKSEVNFLRPTYPLGWRYARLYSIANIEFAFSQVMIADEPTIDWTCKTIVPNSDGGDTDGTGVVGDINETSINNSTFISFDTAGQHRSFKALARNLTNKVKAFTVAARIRLVVETSPDKIRPYVRPAGAPSRYYGNTFQLTLGYKNYEYTWNTNPQTGVAWTTSEINDADLEFGWEVVA